MLAVISSEILKTSLNQFLLVRMAIGSIKNKSWLNMAEGEEVIWSCHPTMLMYLPKILVGLTASLIGLGVYFSGFWQGLSLGLVGLTPLAVSGLGLLYIGYQLLLRQSIYYVATDRKVIQKDGIIRRHRNPVNYSRVSNIKAKESALERFVSFFVPKQNIGDVLIHTSDDNLGDLRFKNIGSVNEGIQIIQEQLNSTEHFKSTPATEN